LSNGALGSFMASTAVYPGYPRSIELSGTNGTVILVDDRLVAYDLRHTLKEPVKPALDAVDLRASSPVVNDFRPHQAVLEDFIRAIEANSQPECDGREARRSLAVIEAIYLACSTGQREVLIGAPLHAS